MPTERMGPPPGASPPMRMTASWSGSKRTYRIQVCGAKMRPNGELPSDHYADRRRQTPELRRKAHLAVHRPSACSGVKALRNTSDAKAASRQAPLAFRSLDPFRALREPDRSLPTRRPYWHPEAGTVSVDDPRWREPVFDMAPMPTERMGPPPGASPPMRMTASWSGSKRTYRIQVCGAKPRPNGELPSDHYVDT